MAALGTGALFLLLDIRSGVQALAEERRALRRSNEEPQSVHVSTPAARSNMTPSTSARGVTCPECSTPGQQGRLCRHCGALLVQGQVS